jgi:hypothetical protein
MPFKFGRGSITTVFGIRNQFHHLIDIVPTILEAAGIQAPDVVDGIPQKPIEGVSMVYTFDAKNANTPSRHHTQYFEMMGDHALYHDGWIASTKVMRPPWHLAGAVNGPLIRRGCIGRLLNRTRTTQRRRPAISEARREFYIREKRPTLISGHRGSILKRRNVYESKLTVCHRLVELRDQCQTPELRAYRKLSLPT